MERAAFLIERSGERIGCLLNPNSLVIRRLAGIRSRRSSTGPLSAARLTDDPLLFTGGGKTELTLDLLFDVSLAGSSIIAEDVRQLTAPLWRLAENVVGADGYGQLPVARFIWGKSWNIPGVVSAVAERLEQFDGSGAPSRSWLRIRFLRVGESTGELDTEGLALPPTMWGPVVSTSPRVETSVAEQDRLSEVVAGDVKSGASLRIDEVAYRYFSKASAWRLVARFNDIVDPLRLPVGKVLRIPSWTASGQV